jgi:hypothetical protein
MDFFALLYSWLVNWYGSDLDAFLCNPDKGMNYVILGLGTLIISFFVAFLYYVVFDKPKWAHWWCWIIALGINGFLNFWWGWQPVLQNYYDGDMDVLNEQTGKMVCYVQEGNCFMFGVANMILAILLFVVFSVICRFFSTNVKYSPLCK